MQVTFRSIVIGFVLIPMNSFWLALAEVVWYTGEPTTLSLYANVVFIMCLMVVGNAGLKRVKSDWALTPAELLVVYIMLSIASAVGGHDMIEVLIPTLTFLHQMAPIEGRYFEIRDSVPEWLVVTDPKALDSVYMGQESIFRPENYQPWLQPLAWWFAFIVALCAVMWGLNLVFRKQWTEHEKLAYPIIQVPMLLATGGRELSRSKPFWIAFSIASAISIINGLNALNPLFPSIPIVQVMNLQTMFTERPWSDMGPAWVSFYPSLIGICFFMPLDLAFSAWFFFWFWRMQMVATSYYGVQGMPGFPFIQEQAAGGYYVIALTALWVTRLHLYRLLRILIGKPVEGATRWEKQEAFIAAGLILGGGGFLYYFCTRAGMTPWIVVMFFVLYYLLCIAITRMRAELGPPSHDLFPVGVHRQMVNIFGAVHMREHYRPDLIMFGFLNFFNRVMRTHPMPHGIEGFRIAERMKMEYGRLLIAMFVAIVTGTLGMFFALLWSFNRYGLTANVSVLPEVFARETWDNVNMWINHPPRWQAGLPMATAIGMITALALAVMRMNLTWWPFHPVGYALSASYTMERIWLCVFIAWLVKALVLRYAGAKFYKPAFQAAVGLIIGDFFMGSFWYTYGIIMETDVYHFWPY